MEIYYCGQVTKKEYTNVLKMHVGQQMKWLKWINGVILGCLLLGFIFTVIRQPSIFRYVFPGLLLPLLFTSFPWWVPYLQASSYNYKGNIYRTPVNGVIDETGITVNGPVSNTSFLWKAYTHYKKSRDLLVLYQGKSCFNIFTRSMFGTDEEWGQFEEAIKRKIAGKQGS